MSASVTSAIVLTINKGMHKKFVDKRIAASKEVASSEERPYNETALLSGRNIHHSKFLQEHMYGFKVAPSGEVPGMLDVYLSCSTAQMSIDAFSNLAKELGTERWVGVYVHDDDVEVGYGGMAHETVEVGIPGLVRVLVEEDGTVCMTLPEEGPEDLLPVCEYTAKSKGFEVEKYGTYTI